MLSLPLLVGPAYVQNSGDEKNSIDLHSIPSVSEQDSVAVLCGVFLENSRILTSSANKGNIGAFGSSETDIIRTNGDVSVSLYKPFKVIP